GNFTGSGAIRVGGSLALDGTTTMAALGSVVLTGGSLAINGLLDNTSGLLGVGNGTAFGTIALGGTILGGVVWDGSSGFAFNNATLDGVSYRGVLDLSGNNATVTIADGITLTGTSGSGPGTILLTGVASA